MRGALLADFVATDSVADPLPAPGSRPDVRSIVSSDEDLLAHAEVIRFSNAKKPRPLEYAVWSLADVKLARPMLISLEEDNGDILAANDELNLWGVGSDKYKALSDFAETFKSVLVSYGQTALEDLTEDAIAYRRALQSYVRR